MKNLFQSCYQGKRVLVTGHTGFKGSWLSLWLTKLGADVVGYALAPYTAKDNFVLSGLENMMANIQGDIRDYESLARVFDQYQPEIVFHLAAQPLVRQSYQQPKETYEVNFSGTVNVLECIRKSNSAKVGVMITTDKCYENKEWLWGYRENDPLGGYDPYSSSKAAAEICIAAYRNSFFNQKNFENPGKLIASVRAGNVIGGGDWSKDRIIPDCIRALEYNNPIQVRNPVATRPWQHVLDPLGGYLLLASKLYANHIQFADAWNFGPDFTSVLPVKDIVEAVVRLWGEGSWNDTSDKNAVHEATLLSLDCSKAKTLLDWNPVFNIEETLKLTVDWYRDYEKKDVRALCFDQIDAYTQKLEELK